MNDTAAQAEQPLGECARYNPCAHKCNDDGGQVTCSCEGGYKLGADRFSCVGMYTESLIILIITYSLMMLFVYFFNLVSRQ